MTKEEESTVISSTMIDSQRENELKMADGYLSDAKNLYRVERLAAAAEKIDEAKQIVARMRINCEPARDISAEDECSDSAEPHPELDSDITKQLIALENKIETDTIICEIYKDLATIESIMLDVYEENNWKVQRKGDKNSDDIRVLYKVQDGEPLITLRIQGEIASPLLGPLSVLNEVDLYKTWIPMMNFGIGKCGLDSSFTLDQLSVVSKIVHLNFICPWPFDNRDLILVGHGYNLLAEKGTIVVTLKSPTLFGENESFCSRHSEDDSHKKEEEEDVDEDKIRPSLDHTNEPPKSCFSESPDRVRMEAVGHVFFKYISENRCFCQVQMKVDVKLQYIPAPVLNFVTRTVASTVFSFFKKKCVEIFKENNANNSAPCCSNGSPQDKGDTMMSESEAQKMYPSPFEVENAIKDSHRARIADDTEFYVFVRNALKEYEAGFSQCEDVVEKKTDVS